MRTLWSVVVVFVLAACGGGNSEKATPAAPAAPAPAEPAAPAASKSAAEDADQLNKQGKESMFGGKYDDAELKFRSALALDPKPLYAFNLCVAQFQLGKFAEAKTACKTAAAGTDAAVADKATKMIAKIDDEAKKQGIPLP